VQAIAFMSILLLSAADYGSSDIVLVATLAGAACAGMFKAPRRPSLFAKRLSWDTLFATHKDQASFKVHIRMSPQSFLKLLSFVCQDLEVNNRMAALRGGGHFSRALVLHYNMLACRCFLLRYPVSNWYIKGICL